MIIGALTICSGSKKGSSVLWFG